MSKPLSRCISLSHAHLFSHLGGAGIDATLTCYFRICWTQKEKKRAVQNENYVQNYRQVPLCFTAPDVMLIRALASFVCL